MRGRETVGGGSGGVGEVRKSERLGSEGSKEGGRKGEREGGKDGEGKKG